MATRHLSSLLIIVLNAAVACSRHAAVEEPASAPSEPGERDDTSEEASLRARAVEAEKRGDIAEAIALTTELAALRSDDTSVLNTLAGLYGVVGQFAEEEEWARKAIELDGAYAPAWINLGNALGAIGKAAEARSAFEKAAELDPKDARPWYGLAVTAELEGKAEEAAHLYRQSLDRDPKFGAAAFGLAAAYGNLGQLGPAIRTAAALQKAEPEAEDVKELLARLRAHARETSAKWTAVSISPSGNAMTPKAHDQTPWDGSAQNAPVPLYVAVGSGERSVVAGGGTVGIQDTPSGPWRFLDTGVEWIMGGVMTSPSNVFLAGEELLRSVDGGSSWERAAVGDISPYAAWGEPKGRVFLAGSGGVWTLDGQERFRRDLNVDGSWFYGVWGRSADEVYAAGKGGQDCCLFRYNGDYWEQLALPEFEDGSDHPKFVAGLSDGTLVVAATYTVWLRRPGEDGFTEAKVQHGGEILGLWVSPKDELYFGGRNRRLHVSKDAGRTWSTVLDAETHYPTLGGGSFMSGWVGLDGRAIIVGDGAFQPRNGSLFQRGADEN